MNDSRDFKKEYDAFLKKVPYQTAVVDGVKVRYQYGGRDGAPVILFFNGLEMQEMWMPYAERLGKKYRFLIYEYPFHTGGAGDGHGAGARRLCFGRGAAAGGQQRQAQRQRTQQGGQMWDRVFHRSLRGQGRLMPPLRGIL